MLNKYEFMKWIYLKKWIDSITIPETGLESISGFEDQYLISFKKQQSKIQINLNQRDCFPFITKRDELPFKSDFKINNISQMLSSARLSEISLADDDRIMMFHFLKRDIYNQTTHYVLVVELIPRFQNIVLCRKEENKLIIAEALRKFSLAENSQRQILLNIEYMLPETDFKVNKDDDCSDYSILTDEYKWSGSSINEWFENLFYEVELSKRLGHLKKQKINSLAKAIKKVENKLHKQQEEMNSANRQEEWHRKAELIKYNLHSIKPGDTEFKTTNYYSPDQEEISIKLFPDKKPQENLQYYLKKFRKARSGIERIKENISTTKLELKELQHEMDRISRIDTYTEMIDITSAKHASHKKQQSLPFRRLRINADWEIMIGRKARENDLLTTRVAKHNDWWFHTRIYQGTHVVLRNYSKLNPPDELMEICCRLAAYYSKAKTSVNVPVDYTQIRYVTKPRGAVPGYVIYKNQKTVYVNPLDFREARTELERLGYLIPTE